MGSLLAESQSNGQPKITQVTGAPGSKVIGTIDHGPTLATQDPIQTPVEIHDPPGAGLLMQTIHVLRHQQVYVP